MIGAITAARKACHRGRALIVRRSSSELDSYMIVHIDQIYLVDIRLVFILLIKIICLERENEEGFYRKKF